MEYPKGEYMARLSIHSMNLKGKRLETGEHNMKIISEKEKSQTFFSMKKVGRSPVVSDEIFTQIKCIFNNLCMPGVAISIWECRA